MLALATADFAKNMLHISDARKATKVDSCVKRRTKRKLSNKNPNTDVSKRSVIGSSILSNEFLFSESANLGADNVFEDDDNYMYDGCCSA